MTEPLSVALLRLPHAQDLPLPAYESEGAAGMDLRAAVAEPVMLGPGARGLIATGISIQLPPGFEAQVRPRSGLALHRGVTVLNSPGTVDSDFRGEVSVVLINHGADPFVVSRGDRIAQLVVAPVSRVSWSVSQSLQQTCRGAGAYGSTGVASPAEGES